MEYRVHITYAGALSEEEGDRLLNVLLAAVPKFGPVLSGTAETFSITLAMDARSGAEALGDAELCCAVATGEKFLRAEVELVDARAIAHA